jgi:protein-disulfide isomerase
MENTTPAPDSQPQKRGGLGQLGTLLLGMVIGGALVAGLGNMGAVRQPGSATSPPDNAAAIRAAARDGAREGAATAIAALPAQQPAAAGQPAQENAASSEQVFAVDFRAANTRGNADAPVTIVEYSDFECGYCRSFYNTTFKQIVSEYVANGVVKISYKHYPFLAESSLPKAQVAECAAEQGKFWDMHDALFSGSVPRADDATIRAEATKVATQMGMDSERFGGCLNDDAVRQRIIADASEGQRVGVRGTPTFLINGRAFVGAQPFAAFKIAIEQALADRKQ